MANDSAASTTSVQSLGRRWFGVSVFGLLVAIAIGVCLGEASYTFHYAEGLSYFSPDPKACVNCHIMRPQYDGWQKASHHSVATCVDCHLPHTFAAKYVAKAENGFWHSKGFTLQDFHEPIVIGSKNRRILQHNCLHCHEGMVHDILTAQPSEETVDCIHCHRTVGHGDEVGLGKYEPISKTLLEALERKHDAE